MGRTISSRIIQLARHLKGWARLAKTSLRPRPAYPEESDRYFYQNAYINFDIKKGDRVLDIGSGHYPFPGATILMDLFLEKNLHRSEPLVRDGRPLTVADILYLPFKDRSFDFIYCSHLLEHVEDPVQACKEIMRVGGRGYIETPNFTKDVLFGWAGRSGHKWHTVCAGNTLIFFEYTESQKNGIGSGAWHDLTFAPYYHPLQEAFWKNQNMFNTMFAWNNNFKVVVFRNTGEKEIL